MSQQMSGENKTPRKDGATTGAAGDHQANELETEQESAAAMDADVPQPPDADRTTEGQPS